MVQRPEVRGQRTGYALGLRKSRKYESRKYEGMKVERLKGAPLARWKWITFHAKCVMCNAFVVNLFDRF